MVRFLIVSMSGVGHVCMLVDANKVISNKNIIFWGQSDRNSMFTIEKRLSIGGQRKLCISRSATQTYQSLTVSIGLSNFYREMFNFDRNLDFLSETSSFYRAHRKMYWQTKNRSAQHKCTSCWQHHFVSSNFYRKPRFSIGDSISIGWQRKLYIVRIAIDQKHKCTSRWQYHSVSLNFYREPLNFYRKHWFSIGGLIFYRVPLKNTHCRNINWSATQTYQSLPASFGSVEFLSGNAEFLSETNFYRKSEMRFWSNFFKPTNFYRMWQHLVMIFSRLRSVLRYI